VANSSVCVSELCDRKPLDAGVTCVTTLPD
jgi:hypothetical protein